MTFKQVDAVNKNVLHHSKFKFRCKHDMEPLSVLWHQYPTIESGANNIFHHCLLQKHKRFNLLSVVKN